MKIHQQKDKVQLVTDRETLMKIAICLSESSVLSNRMLALTMKEAMDDLNRREEKQ